MDLAMLRSNCYIDTITKCYRFKNLKVTEEQDFVLYEFLEEW